MLISVSRFASIACPVLTSAAVACFALHVNNPTTRTVEIALSLSCKVQGEKKETTVPGSNSESPTMSRKMRVRMSYLTITADIGSFYFYISCWHETYGRIFVEILKDALPPRAPAKRNR